MSILKSAINSIGFWIVFFFILRLHGITNPPLEVSHNWRQTTVNMVARNYLEVDNNILYPRVDMAGDKTGITGMEFPIFNYTIYAVSSVFGYEHWYGRLINLLLSSIGILYFFKCVRIFFSQKTALYSSLFLLGSIWFAFSRKVMPDTFSVSLVIIGIYHALTYFSKRGISHFRLILFILFTSLGILAKLPSGFLLGIFMLHLVDRSISYNKKYVFSIYVALLLAPVFLWYFYWSPFLVDTYGYSHFFSGRSLIEGFSQLVSNPILTLKQFYESAIGVSGFIIFTFSWIWLFQQKEWKLINAWLILSLIFFVFMLKGGFNFYHHNYYIIPFVPIMALVAGRGMSELLPKWAIPLMLIFFADGIARSVQDFHIRENYAPIAKLEEKLDVHSKADDLILINSRTSPTPMYFSHRKGWIESNDVITPTYLNEVKSKGCKWVVILKSAFGEQKELDLEKVYSTKDYDIYQL